MLDGICLLKQLEEGQERREHPHPGASFLEDFREEASRRALAGPRPHLERVISGQGRGVKASPPEKAACARVTLGQHRAVHQRSEPGRDHRGRAGGPRPSTTELLATLCSHPRSPPTRRHSHLPPQS